MKPIFVLLLVVLLAAVGLSRAGSGAAEAAGPCNPAIQPCL